VIVSLHVATGAAGGALVGSRGKAVLVGALLHVAGDRIPHMDIRSRRFELASGVALLALLVARRGLDGAVIGALAASLPDVEHVVRLPRPRGRKLFPSHRYPGWHRPGRLSTATQLVLAGALVGLVVASRARALR
jgi:hypothetical protein